MSLISFTFSIYKPFTYFVRFASKPWILSNTIINGFFSLPISFCILQFLLFQIHAKYNDIFNTKLPSSTISSGRVLIFSIRWKDLELRLSQKVDFIFYDFCSNPGSAITGSVAKPFPSLGLILPMVGCLKMATINIFPPYTQVISPLKDRIYSLTPLYLDCSIISLTNKNGEIDIV